MKRMTTLGLCLVLGACTQVVEINGHKIDNKVSAQDHVEIAAQFIKQGDDQHAQLQVQRALELNPDSSEAYDLQAILMQREGNLTGADKSYRKSVSLDGSNAQSRNNYGTFLYQQGRYKEAVLQLQVAADNLSYSGRDHSLVNLGQAAVKTGDLDLAESSFGRAMHVNPAFPDAVFEMADLQFTKGNTVVSHNLYQQFLQMTGNAIQNPRSLWLGIRLERIFGDQNALSSYELALKNIYPESPEYKAYAQSLQARGGS